MEIKNAIITNISITRDDHGFLTSFIKLDYDGRPRHFGGYDLHSPKRDGFTFKSFAGFFFWEIMNIVGVYELDKIIGKAIRVRIGDNRLIEAIGNIIEDKWFCPKEAWDKHFEYHHIS